MDVPKCHCGKPATNWARDSYRRENPLTGGYEFSPVPNSGQWGCDEHLAQSKTIDLGVVFPAAQPSESE